MKDCISEMANALGTILVLEKSIYGRVFETEFLVGFHKRLSRRVIEEYRTTPIGLMFLSDRLVAMGDHAPNERLAPIQAFQCALDGLKARLDFMRVFRLTTRDITVHDSSLNPTYGEFGLTLSEDALRDHHVDADVAVDELRDPQVGGDAREPIGIRLRQGVTRRGSPPSPAPRPSWPA